MNKENTKEKTTIEAKEDPFDDPLEDMLILVSIPGLVTPVSGPSETSIPGNRKP